MIVSYKVLQCSSQVYNGYKDYEKNIPTSKYLRPSNVSSKPNSTMCFLASLLMINIKYLNSIFYIWVCNKTIEVITLFRSIIVLFETYNIPHSIPIYSPHIREYYVAYCQSHITLLWIWIMNVGNIREYYVEYCQSHITLLWTWKMNVRNIQEYYVEYY